VSIALAARIKELERVVQLLWDCHRQTPETGELLDRLNALEQELARLKNRPKPGRPPKNA
jgi:hypothetical protein